MDNLVTSYPNPDTDGAACALALAPLLGEGWRPGLLGALGEETRCALRLCGLEPPPMADEADLIRAESLALVDTHHPAQLPPALPRERVILVVDHHPNGDAAAFPNARICNGTVGAAATLLAPPWLARPDAPAGLLKLLALAIVSNTLHFSAPSTAAADREAYARLTRRAPLREAELGALFAAREEVLAQGLEAALLSDLKAFDTPRGPLSIAQLELYGLLSRIDPGQAEEALARIAQARGLPLLLFNGVDIQAGKSLVVCANGASRQAAERLLNLPFPDQHQVVERILLRKTDFLPRLGLL